jgi:Holliday junction resolvase RusA-like endonuclease
VTRWGTYYTKTYKNWMQAAAPFVEACKTYHEGPLAVIVEVICPRPKTVERAYPRGDVDNYEKAALDIITKGESVWDDDDQVVMLIGVKRFVDKGEEPRTIVEVYRLD